MTDRAREDVDLIARYLAGDVDAFNELMEAHENRVFGICLRIMRDREAALDAVQETFITVFRKADRYRAEAAFSTWLYRVAVNTCYDQLRRRKRRAADRLPETHDPPDRTIDDELASVDVRPAIEEALSELTPEFRAAVVLVDLEGLSLEMAGDVLGVPVGTVKSRVFRGRRRLAELLGNLDATSRHPRGDANA
ncbi:MAG: sigma-70 family RNA polymerase sigma factor [Acidimicrobiia bacterium]|nr:sigma-70 family RNA polymerase sigma factor [Acidimicrobiia bacterium]NNC74135.1 sigma-70 family RNA polymerase sigma factor [Acidimicrobiia bacterium]